MESLTKVIFIYVCIVIFCFYFIIQRIDQFCTFGIGMKDHYILKNNYVQNYLQKNNEEK